MLTPHLQVYVIITMAQVAANSYHQLHLENPTGVTTFPKD